MSAAAPRTWVAIAPRECRQPPPSPPHHRPLARSKQHFSVSAIGQCPLDGGRRVRRVRRIKRGGWLPEDLEVTKCPSR